VQQPPENTVVLRQLYAHHKTSGSVSWLENNAGVALYEYVGNAQTSLAPRGNKHNAAREYIRTNPTVLDGIEIEHRPGRPHSNVDGVSRQYCKQCLNKASKARWVDELEPTQFTPPRQNMTKLSCLCRSDHSDTSPWAQAWESSSSSGRSYDESAAGAVPPSVADAVAEAVADEPPAPADEPAELPVDIVPSPASAPDDEPAEVRE